MGGELGNHSIKMNLLLGSKAYGTETQMEDWLYFCSLHIQHNILKQEKENTTYLLLNLVEAWDTKE